MRTETAPAWGAARRRTCYLAVLGLLLGSGAFFLSSVMLPSSAQAANITIDQCNDQGPGPGGATIEMDCTVTVVNTIDQGRTSSTVTVTRLCGLDACPPGNGTTVTSSNDLVTDVLQCNNSDDDAAHPITCTVTITNNISADTPNAEPVTPATVNQCVGSATGGGARLICSPYPATTTGATVTQCNGSGNGGAGP